MHLHRFSIPRSKLLPLSSADVTKGYQLLDLVENAGPDADLSGLEHEVEKMLWLGAKAELQVIQDQQIAGPETDFMSEVYLPAKLNNLFGMMEQG